MKNQTNISEKTLFAGAKPGTFEKAKALRKAETKAEKLLWQKLRNRKLNGYKFRRQHPINKFIADFYCHELKLIVEVDGKIHNFEENKEYDKNRTAELEKFDIRVIRFTNEEIFNDIETVLQKITSPQPSPEGKGVC